MLVNLLPGLREIRAPIVSGYLWLVFLFLALHSILPSSSHPGSTLRPLFDLASDLSVLGVATVTSVVAYLVGSAMQEVIRAAGRLLSPRRPLYAIAGTHISPDGRRSLIRTVRIQVDRITRRLFQVALSPGERGIDLAPDPTVVIRELPLVRTLLLGEHPELAGELDRLQAEADLRIGVAAPLGVLSVFLAVELSPGWVFGLGLAGLLLVQGHQRQREAGDFLVGVLQMGRIEAPAVKEFGVSVDAALERTDLEWKLKEEMGNGDGMAAFRYANLLVSSQEFEKAVEPLGVAIEQNVLQGYAELGFIWQTLGDREKAERFYREGAERGDLRARERLADLLRELRRTEEALQAEESDERSVETVEEGEEEREEEVDLPRAKTRIADYQARAEQGDAKAALNLGLLLERRNELPEAINAFRRAVDLDPEDPRALQQLGRAEARQFDFAAARAAYEQALRLQEAELGPDHLEVGTTLADLGGVLSELGHDEQALANQQRALVIQEKELGADHLETVVTRANFGRSLISLGRFEKALSLQEEVIEIEERLAGGETLRFAIALNNLGSIRLNLGEYRAGLSALERSLKLKRHLGASAASTAGTLCNIGFARVGLGEYGRGFDLYEQALRDEEKTFGSAAVSITDTLDGMGDALNRLGRYSNGLEVLTRSLAIKEAHGVSALRIAHTLLGRAEALAGTGDLDGAIETGRRSREIFEEKLGSESFYVARTLVITAEALFGQNRLQPAERQLETAIRMGEASEDERDFFLPRALRAMARVKIQRGNLTEAESFASRAIETTESRFGPLFPELATALEIWADIRQARGEAQAASVARQRALEIRSRSSSEPGPSEEGTADPD